MEATRDELKKLLFEVIEEEFGPKPISIAGKWEEGMLILKPSGDQQPKEIPLEVFFKKIVSLRENLRMLEQKVNSTDSIPATEKLNLQSYITRCYGSLTTFNVLFKEDKHRFVGAGQGRTEADKIPGTENLTVAQARKKLGLREHGE